MIQRFACFGSRDVASSCLGRKLRVNGVCQVDWEISPLWESKARKYKCMRINDKGFNDKGFNDKGLSDKGITK